MNRTCAIYDNNENYARRLMHAMSMKANQQFNIELFTQKDAFEKYLRDGSPTVAMVSESGFYDGISDLYDGSLVVLTEEPENETDAKRFGSNATAVYRYQPMDRIYRELMEHSDLQPKKRLDTFDVIGIYSPVNVMPKTEFALNIAKVLSEKYKVLYINFEEFSGLDEILVSTDDITLSDALYYYRQQRDNAAEKIMGTIRSVDGIDYIAPVMCAEDISYVESEQLVSFVECVGKNKGYEVIILDLSSAVKQPWRLMECCSTIYMPVRNDYLSERKILEFETYFYGIGMSKMLDRIEKVRLPECESGVDRDQYRPFQCVVACHAPDERCDEHPECGVHRYASVWAESGHAYFCDIVCIPDQFDAGAGLSCGTADVSSAFNSYYYQCRAALRAHAECDRSGEPVYSGKSYSNPCCEILCQRRLRSGKVRCRQ